MEAAVDYSAAAFRSVWRRSFIPGPDVLLFRDEDYYIKK